MNSLDTLVLSGLAAALCYPLAMPALRYAGSLSGWFVAKPSTQEQWRQQWTHTLIELLADLDKDGMKQAGLLCRELMWEIIGGDQAGGKK